MPRGVGNAYQTLVPNTAYLYLVSDHYSPDAAYTSVNLADETIAIEWPIPLDHAELSAKDRGQPRLDKVKPIPSQKILISGGTGQLGRALRGLYADAPNVEIAERADLNLTSVDLDTARRWHEYDTIINAAAYTAVDGAEAPEGREAAWAITLVHLSSDYVFDGSQTRPYREDDPVTPLGVYGQTKAAGENIVATVPHHYNVRTSWIIGDGRNFVRTMVSLAERGVNPTVAHHQLERLTFTSELGRASGIYSKRIRHAGPTTRRSPGRSPRGPMLCE